MSVDVDAPVTPEVAPGERSARRPDIQGLRAVAVGLVVAFHAGLPIPGGFVGVDVFFVISGFVITAMLMRERAARGRIDFASFYGRRFLRLTPALALLVAVVGAASFLLQNPFGAQQTTAATGLGAMLLSANLVISHASGDYFADAATTNPLLNTWSLSVEEQFYLLFPALLVAGWSLARRTPIRPGLLVGVLALASFVLSMITTYSAAGDQLAWFGGPQSFAYFSSLTRAWEFAAGALLALLLPHVPAMRRSLLMLASLLGVALVIAAGLLLDDATPFPGLAALLPVAGALLLILAGSQGSTPIVRILGSRPFVAVGDVSYSWYLWHWPVIVFVVLLWPDSPPAAVIAAVASLLPALASYRLVEQPLRRLRPRAWWRRIAIGAATLVPPLAICATLMVGANSGWGLAEAAPPPAASAPQVATTSSSGARDAGQDSPSPPAPTPVTAEAAGDDTAANGGLRSQHAAVRAGCVNNPLSATTCRFGPSGAPSVLLVGDSQAYALADGVIAAATDLGLSTQVASRTGCPFLGAPSSGAHDIPCRAWQADVLDYAKAQRPAVVVIANRSTGYVHPELRWRTVARADGGRATSIAEAASLYRSALEPVLRDLTGAGIPVVVMDSIPDMRGFVDRTSLAAKAFGAADYGKPRQRLTDQRAPALEVEQELAGRISGVTLVDPFPALCDERQCWARLSGEPRYQDEQHLSVPGSLLLQAPVRDALEKALGR